MSKNEGNASDKAAAGGVQAGNTAVPTAKKGRMARILDTIAKYTFFPEDFPCLGCGSELELDRHHLCRECARTLRPVEHCCHICGRAGKEDICSDCRGGRSFCRAVAAYNYTGSCKKLVYAFKFRDAIYAADAMAQDIASVCDFASRVDVVTSVPSRREAMILRGYNQSRELALRVGAILGLPYDEFLRQKKGAKPQHELSAEQRRRNYADSLMCIKPPEGKTVLIIDDVLTTGSTLDACAQLLTENGAHRVYAAVFASVPAFDSQQGEG